MRSGAAGSLAELVGSQDGTEQDAVGPCWLLCTQISACTLSALLFDI